ncbi:MAG: hypothetical protein Tsb009_23270 [Planctomycetaceae bacterium]
MEMPLPKTHIVESEWDDPQFVRSLGKTISPLSGNGSGTGHGNGNGGGKGLGGIFGQTEPGKSYIYVIDCSKSMNYRNSDRTSSRFQQVKIELVRSVGQLGPGNRFYIILFNEKPLPMPSRFPEPASEELRLKYLKWVAQQQADGDTKPLASLHKALRFRPDVIYFLTDGIFEKHVQIALKRIRQKRTVIHTFAMGERGSEELLKTIAETNGGKYRFIP